MRSSLWLIVALAGCYASHEREERSVVADCDALPAPRPVTHVAPPGRACAEGGIGTGDWVPRRVNERAELAALAATDGIVPEQADYDRLARDLAAIEAAEPILRRLEFLAPHAIHVALQVEPDTARRMEAGEYHEWACMNAHYPVQSVHVSIYDRPSVADVTLELGSVIATELVVPEYAALAGVGRADAGWPRAGSNDGFCFVPDGDAWHYLYGRGYGDCPAGCPLSDYYYFITHPDGTLERAGTFLPHSGDDGRTARPCWLDLCDPRDPYGIYD